uniref:Uncharacterized protein n=2 Tax=Plectus sambesii TaxID=2011161 RepID=A0A914X328_9BILA
MISSASAAMLPADQVPDILKRKHIAGGYRPPHQSWSYYLKSVFLPHNEVVNVWTHLLPVFCFFYGYLWPELQIRPLNLPLVGLFSGIIALMLGSTLAHLLHSRSKIDHIFWFLIDFVGIAFFGIGIGVQRYSCATHSLGFTLDYTFLPLHLAICLILQFFSNSYLFVCHTDWAPRLHLRIVSSLVLAVWLYVPLYPRYYASDQLEEDVGLLRHNRAGQWLLLAGLFMGANIPERWAPGKFDLFGYGHQLFHICVNMVAWNLCEAAKIDCGLQQTSGFINGIVIGCFVISALLIYITLYQLMKIARKMHL